MGATVLTVTAEDSRNRGPRERTGSIVTTLTLRDARTLVSEVPGIQALAAEYRSTVPLTAAGLARPTTVAGVEPSYAALRDAPVARGAFFSSDDDDEAARVVVLGAVLARAVFGGRPAVGEQVRLRGIPFTVVGVLPDRGAGLDAFDEDEAAFIPLKTARRRLFHVDHVQRFYIRVTTAESLSTVAAAIVALLDNRHRRSSDNARDFRVQDQQRLVRLRDNTIHRLREFEIALSTALLGAAATGAFAFQTLALRERRVEIGTRRALGAARGMIVAQFLLESVIVSVGGTLAGIAAGLSVTQIVGVRPPIRAACMGAVVVVVATAAAAIVPALRAAMSPPAVALRAS